MDTKFTKGSDDNTPTPLALRIERDPTKTKEYLFKSNFSIGRGEECDVRLQNTAVSRVHANVEFTDGRWWYHDKQSTNGSFKDGIRIEKVPLTASTRIGLGADGPVIHFSTHGNETPDPTRPAQEQDPSLSGIIKHYFGDTNAPAGQHTQMVRKAFKRVSSKQRKLYLMIIAGVAVVAIGFGVYSYFQSIQLEKVRTLAEDIFYQIKQMDLDHAALVQRIARSDDEMLKQEAAKYTTRRRELQDKYDAFIKELGIYEAASDREKAILRVARMFGECEVNMPKDFVTEVKRYIDEWKKSPRLRQAVARAEEKGYSKFIASTMMEHNLPPHFYFLGLQESDFIVEQVGPQTRFGVAKGMWQFIATTATQYGLKTGPLAALPRYDPADERHDFRKSTVAAARYISDIYNTEAQASGLLVMASYNWGHNVVRGLVRKMPHNPRERNFWTFFKQYKDKLPRETYNYVFYIVSAAVICDNPGLFGFNLQNPLEVAGVKFGM